MTYRIESRQQNVVGLGGHNYLALVDENGVIKDQIHGVPAPNRRLVHVDEYGMPEVPGAAREVVSGSEADVRRVWNIMKGHAVELGGDPDRPGTRDDDAKVRYGILTPNSNSFWATVLTRSGFDYSQFEPDSSLWTPGTGINISNPEWWVPEHRWPGTSVPDATARDGHTRAQSPQTGESSLAGSQAFPTPDEGAAAPNAGPLSASRGAPAFPVRASGWPPAPNYSSRAPGGPMAAHPDALLALMLRHGLVP